MPSINPLQPQPQQVTDTTAYRKSKQPSFMQFYDTSAEGNERAAQIVEENYRAKGEEMAKPDPMILAENRAKYQNQVNDLAQMSFKEWIDILIATFKYQDPMEPKDPSEVAAQFANIGMTVGFAETRKDMSKILDMMTASMSMKAGGHVGKNIEVEHNHFMLKENQDAEIGFYLARPASKVMVDIYNEKGRRVTTLEMTDQIKMGRNMLSWDGVVKPAVVDPNTKEVIEQALYAPPAHYTFDVKALDPNGDRVRDFKTSKPLAIPCYVKGVLEESFMDGKNPRIKVDGMSLPLSAWKSTDKTKQTLIEAAKQDLLQAHQNELHDKIAAQQPPIEGKTEANEPSLDEVLAQSYQQAVDNYKKAKQEAITPTNVNDNTQS